MNEENRKYYISIAEQFENDALYRACQSLGEFFLSTDNIKPEDNYLEKDLTIKLKDCQIQTNYIFASLISNKIRKSFQENKINYLDFSNFIFPRIISNILQIYEGVPFLIDEYDLDEIIDTFSYLQIDFCKYQSIILTIEQFQRILSSPDFNVSNENQLFKILFNKIQDNPEFLSLFFNLFILELSIK
jgi:hypothetical protein